MREIYLLGGILAGMLCFMPAERPALAACSCPSLTLNDHIAGAMAIFIGHALMSVPVPQGESPFHSEQTLQTPKILAADLVTLFRVDAIWKGDARKTVRVRHEQGACGAIFEADVPVIVFAERDAAGILWTRACSGNAAQGDANFDLLKEQLTNSLRYN